ncbi:hypothetical protein PLICRDRAFT_180164 [Plicaturopsis crispa FD-325 SS-3]|uniref:DUF6534 domain-containing protein n=1 Tax=Plicaturopsis crispa FD-325 SS-3 TaxID=944288 RepID=A0A0C9SWP1_PLICR|nr:hypothetical protein PLICRDRAFT_180164 [Plicaturopsis crispa FD-325 SS-3]
MSASSAVDLQKSLGATEVGVLISLCLFGVVSSQTYTYFRRFDDAKWIKALVGFIWICELAYSVCVSFTLYTTTVMALSQPSLLMAPRASTDICVLLLGVISALCKAFFARRIRILSDRRSIAIVCWVLCVVYFATIIWSTIKSLSCTTWTDYIACSKSLDIPVLSTGALTDLLITGSLCYYLIQERSRAITPTIAVLDKLLVWTIQNCLLTSVTSFIMSIILLAAPMNFTWLAILMFLPRLFSMSLLESLNARTSIRRDLSATVLSTVRVHVTENLDSPDNLSSHADVAARKEDISAQLCPSEEKAVTTKTVRILEHGTTSGGTHV